VNDPPAASTAAPSPASSSASTPGASRLLPPNVGTWSSHSSLEYGRDQSNRQVCGSPKPSAARIPAAAASHIRR
jgi:hypothetical protein